MALLVCDEKRKRTSGKEKAYWKGGGTAPFEPDVESGRKERI